MHLSLSATHSLKRNRPPCSQTGANVRESGRIRLQSAPSRGASRIPKARMREAKKHENCACDERRVSEHCISHAPLSSYKQKSCYPKEEAKACDAYAAYRRDEGTNFSELFRASPHNIRLSRYIAKLKRMQSRVLPVFRQKLIVSSLLYDLSPTHNDN